MKKEKLITKHGRIEITPEEEQCGREAACRVSIDAIKPFVLLDETELGSAVMAAMLFNTKEKSIKQADYEAFMLWVNETALRATVLCNMLMGVVSVTMEKDGPCVTLADKDKVIKTLRREGFAEAPS